MDLVGFLNVSFSMPGVYVMQDIIILGLSGEPLEKCALLLVRVPSLRSAPLSVYFLNESLYIPVSTPFH